MHKPRLSFLSIWNMCFGFFGIQVGFALQNANVSRIFQTLGADIEDIPILWIAAPLTGLLVQPIIGAMSDRTWGWLGRRRPYFFYGALATTAALIVMPNSPYLWVAAGMLWIMDASINATMEPFRAFVGDNLPDKQRTTGFAMQTFFIGSGAVLASALPYILTEWVGLSNQAQEGAIPQSVLWSFYIGAVLLFGSVMWTVVSSREYSPEELEAFEETRRRMMAGIEPEQDRNGPGSTSLFLNGGAWLIAGGILTILISQFALQQELFVLSTCGVAFGLLQIGAGFMRLNDWPHNPFTGFMDDLYLMPKTMRQLAVVQFFSWFALFSMWIYSTPTVTAFHFGATDVNSELYNVGANWVGILFAAYNLFAALAAFLIPVLAAGTSRKVAHMVCLILGGLGLASFVVIRDPDLLLVSMIGVGIAWASILSMPYAMLAGALPAGKMGVYMGIFNFFIVIPQLLAATILGAILRTLFEGETVYVLVLGGASLVVAAVATLFVEDVGEEARTD